MDWKNMIVGFLAGTGLEFFAVSVWLMTKEIRRQRFVRRQAEKLTASMGIELGALTKSNIFMKPGDLN